MGKSALILVDIQNDFVPGGALAVRDGDQVVPVANALQARFELVVATQDWHPAGHRSFASSHEGHELYEVIEWAGLEQVLWPDHCVQGTAGAEFVAGLDTSKVTEVFRKGTDRDIDSYSGFFDNGHRQSTGLGAYLRDQGVDAVYLVGLATDFCVKFTALDARRLGLETYLVEDGCRGVEVAPGDVEKALEEMRTAGVHVVRSDDPVPA